MKKVKIHLGPPKTGTTTIQNILESHFSGNFINRNSELSKLMLSFIQGNIQKEPSEIQNKIRKLLLKHELIIFSDERVLLEYSSKNDWRQQLKKLYQIFQLPEIEVEVIIFVRNPVQSIPSLYQQMRSVSWVSKLSLESFILTNQAKVFNYNFLEKGILEAGFTNINYQQFEVLKQKELDLAFFGLDCHIPIAEIKNKSRTDQENRIYIYTAADIIRRNIGILKYLLPIRLRKEIARRLNFKIKEEKISKNPLIPEDFIEAYKIKSSL